VKVRRLLALKSVIRRRWRRQKHEQRRAAAAAGRRISDDDSLGFSFGGLRFDGRSSMNTATTSSKMDPTVVTLDLTEAVKMAL
jgi:hypothetical protein